MNARQLQRGFRKPAAEFSQAPFWWWSGERLEEKRLHWQLREMAKAGIRQVVILSLAPTRPNAGSQMDDPPVFSTAWWDLYRSVCREARRIGSRIWFYDMIGFSPIGMHAQLAGRHAEFTGQFLKRIQKKLSPGEIWDLPDAGEGICAFGRTKTGSGTFRLPFKNRKIAWNGPDILRASIFYALPYFYNVFDRKAGKALIQGIHGEYAKEVGEFFGDVIVGSIQDELPPLPHWSPEFPKVFRERFGYDLRDNLNGLWEGGSREALQMRRDWHTLRAELTDEAYLRPAMQWHVDHGLDMTFDQIRPGRNADPADSPLYYANYLQLHSRYLTPGCDHNGHVRAHSSLAHLHGRKRVWFECFHSTGWGATLEEWLDWLLVAMRHGANFISQHGIQYTLRCGRWEWAPGGPCWRQPYWKNAGIFWSSVSRLSFLLSQGTHVCDILVVWPRSAGQSQAGVKTCTKEGKNLSRTYFQLVGNAVWKSESGILENDRRDFDIGDEERVESAHVVGDRFVIGSAEFRVILLPDCRMISLKAARRLEEFAERGGRVFFIRTMPQQASDGIVHDAEIIRCCKNILRLGGRLLREPSETPSALAWLPREAEGPVPVLHRRMDDGGDLFFVTSAFYRATKFGWNNTDFKFDTKLQKSSHFFRFRSEGVPHLWNFASGTRSILPYHRVGEYAEVTVPFDENPAAIILFERNSKQPLLPNRSHRVIRQKAITGEWKFTLEPTLNNRWRDLDHTPKSSIPLRASKFFLSECNAESMSFGFRLAGWATTNEKTYRTKIPDLGSESGWRPIWLSSRDGSLNDSAYGKGQGIPWGVKPFIPEDYLDLGEAKARQPVYFQASWFLPKDVEGQLLVFSGGEVDLQIDGKKVLLGNEARMRSCAIRLSKGRHEIRAIVMRRTDGFARLGLGLAPSLDNHARPEWMLAMTSASEGNWTDYTCSWQVPRRATTAFIQIACAGHYRLYVNGNEAGREGGYSPSFIDTAVATPFDVRKYLKIGDNFLRIRVFDPEGAPVDVLVDGWAEHKSGKRTLLVSNAKTWQANTRHGDAGIKNSLEPSGCRGGFPFVGDTGYLLAWPRPHPLISACGEMKKFASPGIIPAILDSSEPKKFSSLWRKVDVPAGASALRFEAPLPNQIRIAGKTLKPTKARLVLPKFRDTQTCRLRYQWDNAQDLSPLPQSPVIEMEKGIICLGDWTTCGLSTYSGIVVYEKEVSPPKSKGMRLFLDLGIVRGVAEGWLNGTSLGTKAWGPYRFEATDAVRAGKNLLQIKVANTLAPYLHSISSTPFVLPGQTGSGLFGPVKWICEEP